MFPSYTLHTFYIYSHFILIDSSIMFLMIFDL